MAGAKKPSIILYDINGNILVQANEKLTPSLVKKISKRKKSHSKKILLSRTAIVKDIIEAIDSGIYKTIFSDTRNTQQVIDIITQTKFAVPIIKELEGLKKALPYTYHHILIVAALSIKITLDMEHDGYDPRKIANIGFVHDLGKSRIPKGVLNKKSPLTHAEFKIIQQHPLIDYLLISYYLNNPNSFVAKASFSHHERLDGSGYPRGLRKLDNYVQTIIPCDVFDALISYRPYRSAPYTVRAALDLLLEESKKGRINKEFVQRLISYVRKDKPCFKNLKISRQNRDAPPKINYYGVRAENIQ